MKTTNEEAFQELVKGQSEEKKVGEVKGGKEKEREAGAKDKRDDQLKAHV